MESRNQRVQYKRIAARLQKSELACRLHYHQLTKHRPSIDVEMYGSDYFGSPNAPPRPSPSCSSNISISPPTSYESMAQLKLPSLNSLFDDNPHRRSISLPGTLTVPIVQSQRQLTPPAYILPPPRRLLSPFDETRSLQPTAEAQSYRLPAPNDSHCHGGHQRAPSWQDNIHYRASHIGTPPRMSNFETPRQSPSMYPSMATGDRCSVNALLNHHGSFTI